MRRRIRKRKRNNLSEKGARRKRSLGRNGEEIEKEKEGLVEWKEGE